MTDVKHTAGNQAQDTKHLLAEAAGCIRVLLKKHEPYHNSIEHTAARALLMQIGEAP